MSSHYTSFVTKWWKLAPKNKKHWLPYNLVVYTSCNMHQPLYQFLVLHGKVLATCSIIVNAITSIRATLDKVPRSREHWIQAILLVESFKLVARLLDEGPRPKSDKLRLNLHGTCFGGKINWFGPKNSAKRELLIWRTKNQATDQGTVQLKDWICFKSVQIGS
jgi:hypothetical protein